MTSYAQDPGFAHFGTDRPPPSRTSVLAILSLVFGILCIPFFGVVGLLLGVGAIVGIKASRGRVGGTGLAVAGIIISLIACAMWVGLGIGMAQVATRFGSEAREMTVALQARDEAGIKAFIQPALAAQVTPETLDAFAKALAEHAGAFDRGPKGLMEYGSWANQLAQAEAAAKAAGLLERGMPMPLKFEKGMAMLIIEFDASAMSMDFSMKRKVASEGGHVTNIAIVTNDGKITRLFSAP